MNHSRERLVHVLGRTELRHVIESTTNLITHSTSDVVARNLVLVVYQGLSPYFGINFILCVEMITDVVFLLCNLVKLLLPMYVHSGDGLPQVGTTLLLVELVSHLLDINYIKIFSVV